ncbi:response regulator [Mucilaginibacter pedocola]|uniref:Response regulatory domain-containing protein n=1 Tax=Mucilaginibacter pedocola TaxID=1792845 RepID=A0A1S9PKR5_9SPHI|nr:response regulator [Mucilaginibacter pedocola]OOQ61541.1 hypothetical protein BC343_00220 [Mucilaginibacter pedocola]
MNKRILVLDDDVDFLECVSNILENAGCTVIPFRQLSTPEEILEKCPDCIILDEVLPSISGHTICIILKRIQANRHNIPIVLMSGLADLAARARLCDADAFIQKPFKSNDEFIQLIQDTVDRGAA